MAVSGLNKRHICSHAGFTLVELLVVIGIIGLLISILLPSLSKAQEQSKRIKCAAQVRQHCAALIMYANDNKGRLPDYGNKKGDFSRSGVTATKDELQLVHPELRDMLKDVYGVPRQMFFCPTSPENDSLGMSSPLVWSHTGHSGYGFLGYMFLAGRVELNKPKPTTSPLGSVATIGPYTGFEEVPPGMPIFPAKLTDKAYYDILVTDMARSYQNVLAPSNHLIGDDSTGYLPPESKGGGSNVGFIDGHVEWKGYSDLGQKPSATTPGSRRQFYLGSNRYYF